ncbi:molybdopterin-dependent oxidoreductase [Desulfosporosinus hippei]|uniref:DMSO/TMAO reductase YedYZ, molybdopterin-dependent catalytic subunit n=1 Tax=Desulfosporosinus hippei DSM 8344 TaxID=1121419 RepID=A0A1G8DZ01_9FIRM|nr:molybdopterin-dependent oxidoreductase [Desulfosporosinus hippei]SDH62781.1 DMSO/TMAO reductase YedYZ, molybdopterin-dependent catalytic subunit [Desulfosporosinus hippei DSM 8344]
MANGRQEKDNGFAKRLAILHYWNALLVALLVFSGLLLFSSSWKELLGEAKIWIKWLHIMIGLVSILPVLAYSGSAARHWQLLKGKPWQRLHIIVVLLLVMGLFISGVLLWQFQAMGPGVSNAALLVHDVFVWIGLPLILYHSLTKLGRLKDLRRHQSQGYGRFYTRKDFLRTIIGAGLAISVAPALIKWISDLGSGPEFQAVNKEAANQLLPAPQPSANSAPPVGGGASGSFRSYSVTRLPYFTNDNWSFTINGLVEKPITWNWEEFVALKRSVQVSNFHCVTGWSVYNNTWEGIPLKELLEKAEVKAEARVVKLYSGDGVYTDSLTLQQADMDDIIVAVLHDGQPIPKDLGGPVRLIVPQMYAYKSVKWLNRIELIADDHIGYWGQRGYEQDAWVQR